MNVPPHSNQSPPSPNLSTFPHHSPLLPQHPTHLHPTSPHPQSDFSNLHESFSPHLGMAPLSSNTQSRSIRMRAPSLRGTSLFSKNNVEFEQTPIVRPITLSGSLAGFTLDERAYSMSVMIDEYNRTVHKSANPKSPSNLKTTQKHKHYPISSPRLNLGSPGLKPLSQLKSPALTKTQLSDMSRADIKASLLENYQEINRAYHTVMSGDNVENYLQIGMYAIDPDGGAEVCDTNKVDCFGPQPFKPSPPPHTQPPTSPNGVIKSSESVIVTLNTNNGQKTINFIPAFGDVIFFETDKSGGSVLSKQSQAILHEKITKYPNTKLYPLYIPRVTPRDEIPIPKLHDSTGQLVEKDIKFEAPRMTNTTQVDNADLATSEEQINTQNPPAKDSNPGHDITDIPMPMPIPTPTPPSLTPESTNITFSTKPTQKWGNFVQAVYENIYLEKENPDEFLQKAENEADNYDFRPDIPNRSSNMMLARYLKNVNGSSGDHNIKRDGESVVSENLKEFGQYARFEQLPMSNEGLDEWVLWERYKTAMEENKKKENAVKRIQTNQDQIQTNQIIEEINTKIELFDQEFAQIDFDDTASFDASQDKLTMLQMELEELEARLVSAGLKLPSNEDSLNKNNSPQVSNKNRNKSPPEVMSHPFENLFKKVQNYSPLHVLPAHLKSSSANSPHSLNSHVLTPPSPPSTVKDTTKSRHHRDPIVLPPNQNERPKLSKSKTSTSKPKKKLKAQLSSNRPTITNTNPAEPFPNAIDTVRTMCAPNDEDDAKKQLFLKKYNTPFPLFFLYRGSYYPADGIYDLDEYYYQFDGIFYRYIPNDIQPNDQNNLDDIDTMIDDATSSFRHDIDPLLDVNLPPPPPPLPTLLLDFEKERLEMDQKQVEQLSQVTQPDQKATHLTSPGLESTRFTKDNDDVREKIYQFMKETPISHQQDLGQEPNSFSAGTLIPRLPGERIDDEINNNDWLIECKNIISTLDQVISRKDTKQVISDNKTNKIATIAHSPTSAITDNHLGNISTNSNSSQLDSVKNGGGGARFDVVLAKPAEISIPAAILPKIRSILSDKYVYTTSHLLDEPIFELPINSKPYEIRRDVVIRQFDIILAVLNENTPDNTSESPLEKNFFQTDSQFWAKLNIMNNNLIPKLSQQRQSEQNEKKVINNPCNQPKSQFHSDFQFHSQYELFQLNTDLNSPIFPIDYTHEDLSNILNDIMRIKKQMWFFPFQSLQTIKTFLQLSSLSTPSPKNDPTNTAPSQNDSQTTTIQHLLSLLKSSITSSSSNKKNQRFSYISNFNPHSHLNSSSPQFPYFYSLKKFPSHDPLSYLNILRTFHSPSKFSISLLSTLSPDLKETGYNHPGLNLPTKYHLLAQKIALKSFLFQNVQFHDSFLQPIDFYFLSQTPQLSQSYQQFALDPVKRANVFRTDLYYTSAMKTSPESYPRSNLVPLYELLSQVPNDLKSYCMELVSTIRKDRERTKRNGEFGVVGKSIEALFQQAYHLYINSQINSASFSPHVTDASANNLDKDNPVMRNHGGEGNDSSVLNSPARLSAQMPKTPRIMTPASKKTRTLGMNRDDDRFKLSVDDIEMPMSLPNGDDLNRSGKNITNVAELELLSVPSCTCGRLEIFNQWCDRMNQLLGIDGNDFGVNGNGQNVKNNTQFDILSVFSKSNSAMEFISLFLQCNCIVSSYQLQFPLSLTPNTSTESTFGNDKLFNHVDFNGDTFHDSMFNHTKIHDNEQHPKRYSINPTIFTYPKKPKDPLQYLNSIYTFPLHDDVYSALKSDLQQKLFSKFDAKNENLIAKDELIQLQTEKFQTLSTNIKQTPQLIMNNTYFYSTPQPISPFSMLSQSIHHHNLNVEEKLTVEHSQSQLLHIQNYLTSSHNPSSLVDIDSIPPLPDELTSYLLPSVSLQTPMMNTISVSHISKIPIFSIPITKNSTPVDLDTLLAVSSVSQGGEPITPLCTDAFQIEQIDPALNFMFNPVFEKFCNFFEFGDNNDDGVKPPINGQIANPHKKQLLMTYSQFQSSSFLPDIDLYSTNVIPNDSNDDTDFEDDNNDNNNTSRVESNTQQKLDKDDDIATPAPKFVPYPSKQSAIALHSYNHTYLPQLNTSFVTSQGGFMLLWTNNNRNPLGLSNLRQDYSHKEKEQIILKSHSESFKQSMLTYFLTTNEKNTFLYQLFTFYGLLPPVIPIGTCTNINITPPLSWKNGSDITTYLPPKHPSLSSSCPPVESDYDISITMGTTTLPSLLTGLERITPLMCPEFDSLRLLTSLNQQLYPFCLKQQMNRVKLPYELSHLPSDTTSSKNQITDQIELFNVLSKQNITAEELRNFSDFEFSTFIETFFYDDPYDSNDLLDKIISKYVPHFSHESDGIDLWLGLETLHFHPADLENLDDKHLEWCELMIDWFMENNIDINVDLEDPQMVIDEVQLSFERIKQTDPHFFKLKQNNPNFQSPPMMPPKNPPPFVTLDSPLPFTLDELSLLRSAHKYHPNYQELLKHSEIIKDEIQTEAKNFFEREKNGKFPKAQSKLYKNTFWYKFLQKYPHIDRDEFLNNDDFWIDDIIPEFEQNNHFKSESISLQTAIPNLLKLTRQLFHSPITSTAFSLLPVSERHNIVKVFMDVVLAEVPPHITLAQFAQPPSNDRDNDLNYESILRRHGFEVEPRHDEVQDDHKNSSKRTAQDLTIVDANGSFINSVTSTPYGSKFAIPAKFLPQFTSISKSFESALPYIHNSPQGNGTNNFKIHQIEQDKDEVPSLKNLNQNKQGLNSPNLNSFIYSPLAQVYIQLGHNIGQYVWSMFDSLMDPVFSQFISGQKVSLPYQDIVKNVSNLKALSSNFPVADSKLKLIQDITRPSLINTNGLYNDMKRNITQSIILQYSTSLHNAGFKHVDLFPARISLPTDFTYPSLVNRLDNSITTHEKNIINAMKFISEKQKAIAAEKLEKLGNNTPGSPDYAVPLSRIEELLKLHNPLHYFSVVNPHLKNFIFSNPMLTPLNNQLEAKMQQKAINQQQFVDNFDFYGEGSALWGNDVNATGGRTPDINSTNFSIPFSTKKNITSNHHSEHNYHNIISPHQLIYPTFSSSLSALDESIIGVALYNKYLPAPLTIVETRKFELEEISSLNSPSLSTLHPILNTNLTRMDYISLCNQYKSKKPVNLLRTSPNTTVGDYNKFPLPPPPPSVAEQRAPITSLSLRFPDIRLAIVSPSHLKLHSLLDEALKLLTKVLTSVKRIRLHGKGLPQQGYDMIKTWFETMAFQEVQNLVQEINYSVLNLWFSHLMLVSFDATMEGIEGLVGIPPLGAIPHRFDECVETVHDFTPTIKSFPGDGISDKHVENKQNEHVNTRLSFFEYHKNQHFVQNKKQITSLQNKFYDSKSNPYQSSLRYLLDLGLVGSTAARSDDIDL